MIGPDDHGAVVTFISGLVRECVDARQEWTDQADRNERLYANGADPAPADDEVIANDIQNAVQATTDLQTKEPIAVTLDPVEQGEPPVYYWAGPPAIGLALQLAPEQVGPMPGVQADPAAPPPLPVMEEQADAIHEAMAAGGIPIGPAGPIDPATGMQAPPPMRKVKPAWLVEVCDQTVAEFYQTLFDVYWTRSGTNECLRANLLKTNIEGWSLWLFEFDAEEQRFVIREMSVHQMYIDPTVRDIRFAAYAGAELVLDRDEAIKNYPSFADVIDERAQDGTQRPTDGAGQLGDAYERSFRRNMVRLRIMWIRNQSCPWPSEQAIARGLLEPREIPILPAADEFVDPDPMGVADLLDDVEMGGLSYGDDPAQHEDATAARNNEADDPESVLEGGSDERDASEPGQGDVGGVRRDAGRASDGGGDLAGEAGESHAELLQMGGIQAPRVRTAHFLPGTDTEVDPLHPQYPTYRCVRQLTIIDTQVVDDRESEFGGDGIPIVHNVNRPVPQRPWGIGEPAVLWKLQKAKGETLTAMVGNVKYFGNPVSTMSESMAAELGSRGETLGMHAGKVYVLGDDLYLQTKGQAQTVVAPPSMPPALGELYPLLGEEVDSISGYSEALQGQAQPNVTSGKQLELQQTAGASIIGFKSARTSDMVERLATLMIHELVWRVTVDQILQIIKRYPRHIVEAFVEWGKKIEWNAKPTVASGNGAGRRQKKAEAQNDYGLGLISKKTCQERSNIDPRQEDQRQDLEMEKAARAQAAMMPSTGRVV